MGGPHITVRQCRSNRPGRPARQQWLADPDLRAIPMTEALLKVAHYAPSWLPLTQTWLYHQIRHLPPAIENHIVCRSARNLDQFPVANLHCLKQESWGRYLLHRARFVLGERARFPYFDDQLRRIRPDLVHSHFGNNGWTVFPAVRRQGLPHVVTFYGQDVSRLPRAGTKWLERYRHLFADPGTRFLCEGSAMADTVHQLGCPRDKIIVHHLGVDVGNIRFEPRRWTPGEPLKVLIAACFREKKGIPYALDALAKLRKDLPLQITLIGDAEASRAGREEKQRVLERIERHKLGPVTRLLGFQPYSALWQEACRHHLFVAPSVTAADGDTEGGAPISVIEMAASGMAIVSSFHCDIPDVIRHGQTGWLAAERSVDAIHNALRRWVDAPGEWHRMLSAGREHIERHYDAAAQGLRLAEIYRAGLPEAEQRRTPCPSPGSQSHRLLNSQNIAQEIEQDRASPFGRRRQ